MAAPSVDWRPHVREAARVAAKGMQGKWEISAGSYNDLFRAYLTLQGCRGFEYDPSYQEEETICRVVERWRNTPKARDGWGYLDLLIDLFGKHDEAWFHSHYSTLDEVTRRELYRRCAAVVGLREDYDHEEKPPKPRTPFDIYHLIETPAQIERRETVGWSSSYWIFMRRRQQEQRRARMHRADLATGLPYQHNVPYELVQLIGSFASAAVTPQHPLLPRMQAPSVREYADRGKSARKAEDEVEDEPPAKR